MNLAELMVHGLRAASRLTDGRMLGRDRPTEVGRLGNSQQLLFPGVAGQIAKVRILEATGAPPGAESALLSLGSTMVAGSFAGVGIYQIQAGITWGTGTGRLSALVDMGTGTRLTIPGSHVDVDVLVTALAGPVANPPTFRFDAAIAYGSAGRGIPPTLTRPSVNLANGVAAEFEIPPFAKELFPVLENQTTTCLVIFPDSQIAIPANNLSRVPIPGKLSGTGTVPTVQIQNTSGGGRVIGVMFFIDL